MAIIPKYNDVSEVIMEVIIVISHTYYHNNSFFFHLQNFYDNSH
jgi:hypothetical protein